jgi:nucleotide-binding universal stress UspA family protein/predicted transcriptional regulator
MAYPFKQILIPIEFGDQNCLRALSLAAEIAKRDGAAVALLHAVPLIIVPADLPIYRDLYAPQEKAAEKQLKQIGRFYLPTEIKRKILTPIGDPAKLIATAASDLGADLVVMATHGRVGLSHLLLGSVAQKVVRECPCPVLTIRPEAPETGVVAQRMSRKVVTVAPQDTLDAAQSKMRRGAFRCLPVVEKGKLLGILTEDEIGRHEGHPDRTKVSGAMLQNFSTIDPKTKVQEAAKILLDKKASALPVVENGKLVGILTTSDILGAFVGETPNPGS